PGRAAGRAGAGAPRRAGDAVARHRADDRPGRRAPAGRRARRPLLHAEPVPRDAHHPDRPQDRAAGVTRRRRREIICWPTMQAERSGRRATRARLTGAAVGWGAAACGALVAIGLALTAPGTSVVPPEDAVTRAAIFREMAASEPATRANAARAFPGDPWSADDDFHNHEQWQARAIAARRRIPIETVLRSIDDGLREHWDQPNAAPLVRTVPPCHPRPIY